MQPGVPLGTGSLLAPRSCHAVLLLLRSPRPALQVQRGWEGSARQQLGVSAPTITARHCCWLETHSGCVAPSVPGSAAHHGLHWDQCICRVKPLRLLWAPAKTLPTVAADSKGCVELSQSQQVSPKLVQDPGALSTLAGVSLLKWGCGSSCVSLCVCSGSGHRYHRLSVRGVCYTN